jgi:hypothetical protein
MARRFNSVLHFRFTQRMYLGDVVSVEALGQRYIILGSFKAVTDLFERRSSNFSDRPIIPMLHELYGCNTYDDRRDLYSRFYSIDQAEIGTSHLESTALDGGTSGELSISI